jgi:carbonic anhydrase
MIRKHALLFLLTTISMPLSAKSSSDYGMANSKSHKKGKVKIKAEPASVSQSESPEIQRLLDGNKKFRTKFLGKHQELFDELVQEGQRPQIMIISCSDSRVDPARVFNRKPGLFFGVRNIANLVPPYQSASSHDGVSAALEYGIKVLKVKHVIIFGHTHCGGINTLTEHGHNLAQTGLPLVAQWLTMAQPAYDLLMKQHANLPLQERITLCERYTLMNSLKNLQSFPWIKELVQKGMLTLHAWYFDLDTGWVCQYDQAHDQWVF